VVISEKFIKENLIFIKMEEPNKIIGYHYTNPKAYQSMDTNGVDRNFRTPFNDFRGLIPSKMFVHPNLKGFPNEAYNKVIEGLFEPEPKSWLENPEFPFLWKLLMHDICREEETILLSFELEPKDKAYVVERAHVERELYKEAKGQGKPTRESKNKAFKQYWESRVPVFEYDGSYSAPQLAIWSPIEFERLNVEWVKPTDEVWQRVLDNKW
jgi:hypothetical protein